MTSREVLPLSEVYNCPRCNVKSFWEHEQPLMLPHLIKAKGGSGVAMDFQHGIAVKALVCETCRYVEFKLILGNEDLNL